MRNCYNRSSGGGTSSRKGLDMLECAQLTDWMCVRCCRRALTCSRAASACFMSTPGLARAATCKNEKQKRTQTMQRRLDWESLKLGKEAV